MTRKVESFDKQWAKAKRDYFIQCVCSSGSWPKAKNVVYFVYEK